MSTITKEAVAAHLAEMDMVFGKGAADEYVAMLGATRDLISVCTEYTIAEDDSKREAKAREVYEHMLDALEANPDKAREMIESLCGLIAHMRVGGTIANWFALAGVEIPLLEDEPEG